MITKALLPVALYGIFMQKITAPMSSFGEHLKQIRISRDISQGELAERMGIHPTHISRYERNLTVPSVDVVKKLADILEVTTDALVYGSADEKAQSKLEDSELLNMFKKAQALNESDRNCVKSLLRAFIFQRDMQQQLSQ